MISEIELNEQIYINITLAFVPINSMINPFLYTLDEIMNQIKEKRQLRENKMFVYKQKYSKSFFLT